MDYGRGYVTDQYPQHYTWLRKIPQVGKKKKKQDKNNYMQQSCSMPMFLSLRAVTPVPIMFRDYLSNSPNLKPKPILRYPGEPTGFSPSPTDEVDSLRVSLRSTLADDICKKCKLLPTYGPMEHNSLLGNVDPVAYWRPSYISVNSRASTPGYFGDHI